jgi:hypothetical protein
MTGTLVRRTWKTGMVALLAGAVVALSAGPAAAAEKTLTCKGGFPLIGDQTVSVVVKAEIPATATAGTPVSVPFSLDVDAGQAAGDGLRLVGATKISGSIKSKVNVATSSVDAAATTHVVTDSSLGEFDVELALDPPDQDTTLGTTTIG